MKTLKFKKTLSQLILSGEKNTTWRLFDDKDLSAWDSVSFVISETGEEFRKACIVSVRETTFGELSDEDWEGHEKFASDIEMYETYSGYYHRLVTPESPVKIIKFEYDLFSKDKLQWLMSKWKNSYDTISSLID